MKTTVCFIVPMIHGCPQLVLVDGSVSYEGDSDNLPPYDVATEATYSCDTGFTLIGEHRRQCLYSNTWSGSDSVCEGLLI